MFLRKNLEEPHLAIMFDEPVNVAVFAPKVFKIKKGEKSLFQGNRKYFYVLAGYNNICLYDTCNDAPLHKL